MNETVQLTEYEAVAYLEEGIALSKGHSRGAKMTVDQFGYIRYSDNEHNNEPLTHELLSALLSEWWACRVRIHNG